MKRFEKVGWYVCGFFFLCNCWLVVDCHFAHREYLAAYAEKSAAIFQLAKTEKKLQKVEARLVAVRAEYESTLRKLAEVEEKERFLRRAIFEIKAREEPSIMYY